MRKWVLFPGRFQPFHDGHEAVVRTLLGRGHSVLIMPMRCMGMDWTENPYRDDEREAMVQQRFAKEIADGVVAVQSIPPIAGVAYGRRPGWEQIKVRLGATTEAISGTKIRQDIGHA